MSPVKTEHSYHHLYTIITCPCGRDLRVKRALAGTEVRCWDCHQMVMVPVPRRTGVVLGCLGEGLGDVFKAEVVASVVVGAAVVTGLLVAAGTNLPLAATAALAVLAAGHGELIRRSGLNVPELAEDEQEEEQEQEPPRTPYPWIVSRGILAIVVGLALSAPWLLTPRSFGLSPRVTAAGLALGVLGMILLPLLMFVAYASDRTGPLGPRKAVRALLGHPVVVISSLALFPLGAVIAEGVTLALLSFFGWMPFTILELDPDPQAICRMYGIPYVHDYFIGGLPEPRFVRMYGFRLGQGYTLLEALPHSLGLSRFQMGFPWGFPVLTFAYLAVRVLFTQLMLCIVFLFLAIQARWLGALSTVDSRQSLS